MEPTCRHGVVFDLGSTMAIPTLVHLYNCKSIDLDVMDNYRYAYVRVGVSLMMKLASLLLCPVYMFVYRDGIVYPLVS